MITENLSTLQIHKLTQAQYDRELAAGNLDPNALYLTPDNDTASESPIFIAEYGTTTLDEILEATTAGKATFCYLSNDGTYIPVSYAHLDGAKFIGFTHEGNQEAICNMDNTWELKTNYSANIFVAEYGTTTYEEIFEAVHTDNKTVFCRNGGSVLPLVYAHIDEIKFVGHTSDGEQEAICSDSSVWSLTDVESPLTPTDNTTTVTLSANKLYYYAQPDTETLTINGTVSNIPNGWVGHLTVYAPTPSGVSSSILETTSQNGFTLTDIGLMEEFTMAIMKNGQSSKLLWYLFKQLPSAEEASF